MDCISIRIKYQQAIRHQRTIIVRFFDGGNRFAQGILATHKTLEIVENIVRVVVVGNSIAPPDEEDLKRRTFKNQFGSSVVRYDPQPIETLDQFLSSVCSSVDLDLMPGVNDPTSILMPQQKQNRSIFRSTCRYTSFDTVTNPYQFDLDGMDIICTSGENVNDMFKYLDTVDRLEIAKQTLFCGHLAPTSPDTLWTLVHPIN